MRRHFLLNLSFFFYTMIPWFSMLNFCLFCVACRMVVEVVPYKMVVEVAPYKMVVEVVTCRMSVEGLLAITMCLYHFNIFLLDDWYEVFQWSRFLFDGVRRKQKQRWPPFCVHTIELLCQTLSYLRSSHCIPVSAQLYLIPSSA